MLPKELSGTLGPSLLANYDVEIDPAHQKLNLFSQEHCAGKVVYWTRSAVAAVLIRLDDFLHIILPVTLDGQYFEATLDTGSSISQLVYEIAEDKFGWDKDATLSAQSEKGFGYPFNL